MCVCYITCKLIATVFASILMFELNRPQCLESLSVVPKLTSARPPLAQVSTGNLSTCSEMCDDHEIDMKEATPPCTFLIHIPLKYT